MKSLTTNKLIEEIAKHPNSAREVAHWIDNIWDITSQATQQWREVGNLANDEQHPVEDLIDAVYHDLCAAAYWSERELADEWEGRAKDLGFKHPWEIAQEKRDKLREEKKAEKEANSE